MSPRVDSAAIDLLIKCSQGCGELFPTVKDMQRHKYHDSKHHYCRKCDYDAKDWNDLLDHKVTAMAPFLIGDKRHDKHKKMMHLCCEFCGEDFKSLEGRMAHRREMHQADQQITCAAKGLTWDDSQGKPVMGTCGQVFPYASDLVYHYESGQCDFVLSSQFKAEIQHKRVIKQILVDPEHFSNHICSSKAMSEIDYTSDLSSITGGVSSSASSSGGALLDDDGASDIVFTTLIPRMQQINLLERHIDDSRAPGSSSSSGSRSCSRTSRSSVPSSNLVDDGTHNAGDHDGDESSDGASDRSSSTVRGPSTAAGASSSALLDRNRTALSEYLAQQCTSPGSSQQFSSSTTSSTRRSSIVSEVGAPSIVSDVDWASFWPGRLAAHHSHRGSTTASSDPTTTTSSALPSSAGPSSAVAPGSRPNVFSTAWYDQHSESYNPDLFYQPLEQRYRCPFSGCDVSFDATPSLCDTAQLRMEEHLKYSHVALAPGCPTCRRRFDSVTGLVRHFEASMRGSRCWIAGSRDFGAVVAEVTGGFVGATSRGRGEGRANALSGWEVGRDGAVVKLKQGGGAEAGLEGGGARFVGVREVRFRGETPMKWEGSEEAGKEAFEVVKRRLDGRQEAPVQW